jgi:ADP-heptose:LPS heptosyltransferase
LPGTVKHIAVIRLSAMGDVAMTVPLLRTFAKQYPDVKVTVVSKAFFRPFFDDIPNVAFFPADITARHKGFLGLLRLYSDLKEQKVDAIADLHNVLRSKIIRTLFGISGKKTAATDKARDEKQALTRAENKIFKPLKPVIARHADVFAALGFPLDVNLAEIPSPRILDRGVTKITGEKSGKWIGIAPFAQHNSKVYPFDLMQKVIHGLAENPDNNKIFLLGAGEKELKVLAELAGKHPNAIIVAGKMTFAQELQLISNLDVMLSMDSGNAHIAAMFGVNTITLWGATHPFAGFAPFGQPQENALVSDRAQFPKLPTSVYGNKIVRGYEDAMRTISPETVVGKITSSLK